MQFDIPASALGVQSLIEASLGFSEHEWEIGWSLASSSNDSKPSRDFLQTQVSRVFFIYVLCLFAIY